MQKRWILRRGDSIRAGLSRPSVLRGKHRGLTAGIIHPFLIHSFIDLSFINSGHHFPSQIVLGSFKIDTRPVSGQTPALLAVMHVGTQIYSHIPTPTPT
jgi:hypothetical protein